MNVEYGGDQARVLGYCAAFHDLGHTVVLTFRWSAPGCQNACWKHCPSVLVSSSPFCGAGSLQGLAELPLDQLIKIMGSVTSGRKLREWLDAVTPIAR